MNIEPLSLSGAALIQSGPFDDARGRFARCFCDEALASFLGPRSIRQINLSSNRHQGTLRGLHFQKAPHSDMKFVRCLKGATFHVLVDLRRDSPTYLQWITAELQPTALNMLCVPEGLAHGFQSLLDDSHLMYFVTHPYAPEHQAGLRWNDPKLNIEWPLPVTSISERDARHPLIASIPGGAAA